MEAADSTNGLQAADLDRLALSQAPFSTELGEARFADAAHKTQVNIALHMLQDSERVLVVTGEPGVGKSTFLFSLAARDTPDLAFVPLSGRELTSTSAICEQFLRGLGVALEDRINASDFLKHLWEINDRGNRPTLLLDDADRLPAPVLQSLLQLWDKASADLAPFGLVLAVGNAFDTGRVESQLADPERLHVINLYPFTEQQTAEYIRYRLQAGGNDGTLFTAAEIRQLYQRSRGVPQAINLEAHQLLKAKSKAIARTALARRILLWTAALALTGLAFLIALWLQSDGGSSRSQDTVFDLPLRTDAEVARTMEEETVTRPDWGFSPVRVPQLPDASDLDSATVAAADAAPSMDGEPEQEALALTADTADTAPAADEAEVTVADEPPLAATEAVAMHTPETEEEPSRFDASVLATSRLWLEGRNPHHLTLQLIAAHEVETITRFIERGAMPEAAQVVRTLRDGRDWYVVVVGDHSDRAHAVQALTSLSEDARAEGAWVRSFESLQSALP